MSPPSDGELKKEQEQVDIKPALTPPSSENTDKKEDDSGSELSELEPEEPSFEPKAEEDDDIVPDHFYEGGKVPVFKPVSAQLPIPENSWSDCTLRSQLRRMLKPD